MFVKFFEYLNLFLFICYMCYSFCLLHFLNDKGKKTQTYLYLCTSLLLYFSFLILRVFRNKTIKRDLSFLFINLQNKLTQK